MKNNLIFTLFFLFIFLPHYFSAQETVIYDAYPNGQEAYLGGEKGLYKDFHEILNKNNFEPCQNKNEELYIKVIVKSDSKISLVKNQDTIYTNQNKCTYNLIKKVLPEMNGWKAAEYKGQKLNAIYGFNVFPDDLFADYKDGYIGVSDKKTSAEYPEGGIHGFRIAFMNKFKMPEDDFNGTLTFEVRFIVDVDGSLSDITVTSPTKMPNFERNILSTLKKLKANWIPAKVRGVPVKSRFRFPLSFTSH